MDNLPLPLFLRAVRQAFEISQTKLSHEIGISQPSLAQYESLKISLSPEILLKIASVLNSAGSQLFFLKSMKSIIHIPYKSNMMLPFLFPSKKYNMGGIMASQTKEKCLFSVK